MYAQMLALLRALAKWPELRPCLDATTAGASGSVLTALESVRKQADFFQRTASKGAEHSADKELAATKALAALSARMNAAAGPSGPKIYYALAK